MGGIGRAPVRVKAEPVRIRLLGGFRVAVGDRLIDKDAWRLRKAAALVKLLALADGHRLHREQAMDLLWPDLGRRAASSNLRNALHAARKALDPAEGSRHLASEGDSLVLCPGGEVWVDVEAFGRAAALARGSRDPAAYRAAIELYVADLLPEDRYEARAEDRRRAWRQLYIAMLVELARLHEERNDHEPAIDLLRKATAEEPIGGADAPIISSTLVNLGLAALGKGENEQARPLFEEALVIGRSTGRKPQLIDTLEGMASLAGVTGEPTRAALLWGAAEEAREATGIALSRGERAMHEPYLAPARARLGETAWEAALGEGRAMSLEEAADYVLSEEADQPEATIARGPSAHTEPVDDLTPREREIAYLVSEGLTNRQISTRLSISERTAANHVARILKKLGLTSRVQIASWVTETRMPASPHQH